MNKPRIAVIVGSTRQGRFADHPAQWIKAQAEKHGAFAVETLDLRDHPLPFFDEEGSPAMKPSKNEAARRWQAKVAGFDGFIIIAAEYNHGPTAVLKNALDYAYSEWNNKPVAFVGYGGVGGARSVEALRLSAIELQMAPIRAGIHIQWAAYEPVSKGEKKLEEFDFLNDSARGMLDQLAWWTKALKKARDEGVERREAA